jgi:phosphomannomutase
MNLFNLRVKPMDTLHSSIQLDPLTQKNVNQWLDGQYDEKTKEQVRQLMQKDPQQTIDAFYTHLTFGTGGLRGLMGVGTNRMNFYTVRAATQGLANYIQQQPKETNQNHRVFIGYDSRHQSREFAEETAKVLAGNGIFVYLFKQLRPTPLVSFSCREKKCLAAVMITASHNPPAYNGYKVYWSDGGQVVPPHDIGIITAALEITDPSQVKTVESLDNPLIEEVATEMDEKYLAAISTLQNYPEVNRKEGHQLKVVYTSLYGTGITLVPYALQCWGFSCPIYVEKQIIPDGSFPTTPHPNPEEREALSLGIDLMMAKEADFLIATDPDADRIGVAVRHQGGAVILNGNQLAALCLAHVCTALKSQNRLPERAAFIKTIGTTELFQAICDAYQRPCFNVLTGFKYIAEKIHEWENSAEGHQYIFGGEESYGSLLGTFSRDKDAVVASALVCEMALQAKLKGQTLIDYLHKIYHLYGLYEESLFSINFGETKEGKEQMKKGMDRLRITHLTEINHIPVVAVEDYQASTRLEIQTGKTITLTLPRSDVLLYWLQDESKVMVRPSGTEPKVKLYCGVVEKQFSSVSEGIKICQKRCEELINSMKSYLLTPSNH